MNPFDVLGLAARDNLTDDDVRAAWRRIATATHPDREDGGDPERYAQAAEAYARLRTSWDRGEALADRSRPRRSPSRRRVRGRVLLVRWVAAAAVCWAAYVTAGWMPATAGIMTGAATWLVLTGRRDVPAGRS